MKIKNTEEATNIKILKRDKVYSSNSRLNEPGISVSPGEEFLAETELCTGGWLHSINDRYGPEKVSGSNPTVVAEIKGVMPGDVLAVKILGVECDKLGYTGFNGATHKLARLICDKDWGLTTKTVEIVNGFVIWDDRTKLPVNPMIGTLGTAPPLEPIRNTFGGIHGGNMDANEVRTGSKIYLQAFVPGGLLHIGDVHAIQGDGEINGAGGIECRAEVRLSVDIIKKPIDTKWNDMKWVRIEDESHIMGVACCASAEESFCAAAAEVLSWMVEDYGFSQSDAYLLMGQVMEARCTQFVNPTRTYICKIPKKYLGRNISE